jgi:hypothetical protein
MVASIVQPIKSASPPISQNWKNKNKIKDHGTL